MGSFWTKSRTVFFLQLENSWTFSPKEKMKKYIILGPFWTKNGLSWAKNINAQMQKKSPLLSCALNRILEA